jgi:hypothetical protein
LNRRCLSLPGYWILAALTNFLPTDNNSMNGPSISRTLGTLQGIAVCAVLFRGRSGPAID